MFRTLALALTLTFGFGSTAAFAAKNPHKVKTIKPKKDKQFKNSQVAKVKPRKARKIKQ